MGKIIMVTGGARSGKSGFAEKKVLEIGKKIGYMATAVITDEDMAKRILHHKASRPKDWPTFERYKAFDVLIKDEEFLACDTLIFDCVTTAVTSIMLDEPVDYDKDSQEVMDKVEVQVKKELAVLLDMVTVTGQNLVLVTNEVGLGIVPPYRLGSIFRDIAGRMNQYIANRADEVYFIVSGLPMTLKHSI
ncbi:MAG: bifunctional adenosylcobinamide kinase/adenosylcobinamide-phosphate guanylyltransferase [Firmicutes bacterium HGW-Firmicutes-3]|jgi:adenosylcobinamide kinase/adenosylcobinamide-phosphate guanylyltransferase|nr:MAG: bifunctional adenosylcobinamide kinase/adenosylcobinamide-phosphate guanylyltransferase [Firmicutes bacterium HGW-Firmicutes-3]